MFTTAKVALLLPAESPMVIVLVPEPSPNVVATPDKLPVSVPALMVIGPENALLLADRVSAEVVLSWTMPVTFEPIAALMVVPPAPVPELVMVPALLTEVVESVVPPAARFWMVRS